MPDVGPDDALVRVHACGVCHTDLHVADGLFKVAWCEPFPLIPGHEIAGEGRAVGARVTNVRPGDRVGVYWWLSCGGCRYCLAGEEEACLPRLADMQAKGLTQDGGYAEFVSVPADRLVPLPDGIGFAEAGPFCCAGLTAYAALKNAGLRPAHRVAVLGIGGLGHLGGQIARAMGAEVIAITGTEAKQELARKLGAHHVLAAGGRDVGKSLLDAGGADVILSTTMDFQLIRDTLTGLLPQGTLVLAALTAARLPIDPRSFIVGQQRVVGSYLGSRADLRELLQLAVRHHIRPVVETFPLDDANLVLQRLRAHEILFRAVLQMG